MQAEHPHAWNKSNVPSTQYYIISYQHWVGKQISSPCSPFTFKTFYQHDSTLQVSLIVLTDLLTGFSLLSATVFLRYNQHSINWLSCSSANIRKTIAVINTSIIQVNIVGYLWRSLLLFNSEYQSLNNLPAHLCLSILFSFSRLLHEENHIYIYILLRR